MTESINSIESDSDLRRLLRHPPFRWFWCARILSGLAVQIQTVAVGWQIYDLTRSPFDLGMIGLVQFLPAILLTLVVGQVADRYNRRWIIRICQTLAGCIALTLAIGSHQGWLTKEAIFSLVFVFGIARAFESPSTSALLPQLVPPELFPRAISLSSASQQATIIAGPALGGFIYAAGPAASYSTCAILFILASLLIAAIKIAAQPARREPVDMQSLFAGFAFIRRQPVVLGAISLDMFAVLLGGATALLPIYAREILHTGPWGLGLLRSAPAVGALAMSIYLARRPIQKRAGRTMFIGVMVFGLATIIFALSQSIVVSMMALVLLGASDMISVVIRSALVQLETPDAMRGRVSAVNWLFIGTSNQLGEFESGISAALIGTVPAALVGGIGTLVIATLWMRLFPALLHRDRLVSDKTVEQKSVTS